MTTRPGVKARRREHVGPDRAFLLQRQSLTRTGSVSLEDQERQNRAYAERQGYEIVGTSSLANVKGWAEDRDDHAEARRLALAGEVDVVVAYSVSRAARSLRLLEALVYDLERAGVRMEFAAESFANDAVVRQVIGAFAELETVQRSTKLQSTFEYLRRRGQWHGGAPFGYRHHERTIVPDPEEWETAKQIFTWALDGWGTIRIRDELHRTGVPTRHGGAWQESHLSRMLRNPVFAGGMRIDGEAVWPCGGGDGTVAAIPSPNQRGNVDTLPRWHEPDGDAVWPDEGSCGSAAGLTAESPHPSTHRPGYVSTRRLDETLPRWHEPLIPRAEWERLQAILPTFAVVRSKPITSWLEGLIVHACGQRMYLITTYVSKRDTLIPMFRCAIKYKAQRCRLPHGEASARNVERAARQAYLADRRNVVPVAEVWRELQSDDARTRVEARRAMIRRKRTGIETRRANAEEMRLSGRRNFAWWQERDAAYAAELATLAAEEAALPDTVDRITLEQIAAELSTVDDLVTDEAIALSMRTLGIVAVVGAGGVTLRYGEALALFVPHPVTVRIWRSRGD